VNKQSLSGLDLSNEPVAIIGMACRLPGGNDSPDQLWSFLKARGNGIVEVPQDRWDPEVSYHPNPDSISRSVSKWGGFLDDIRSFDAGFFGISPREAASMDPQQRLLLTATCEAMHDSGRPAEYFSRVTTGVFVGISQSEYRVIQEMRLTNDVDYAGTGYALCINANRISHRLNLTGPSCALDTACSSSMVALDQAVQGLRTGTCDVAVVAGVNVVTHPNSYVAFSKAGMLSPTGRISTFDAAANGFVRAEGTGVVLIKPYARAVADGDRIHAVIRGTAVNQDGFTNTITAPSQDAQIAMLEALVRKSGVSRAQIGYVEAHGTGTPIGDPIEAGAIGRVIGQHNPDRPVFIGSIKANIGHLESGAGITGLIKATLAVRHGEIPPNVNYSAPNPNIPLDALNLSVPTRVEEFPSAGGARHAVVNSFGFGGTNGSVLISSAPEEPSRRYHAAAKAPVAEAGQVGQAGFPLMFPLSGVTPQALAANAAALLKDMGRGGALAGAPLDGISRALAVRRSHLGERAVILARSARQLKAALRTLASGEAEAIAAAEDIVTGEARAGRRLCFMFAGQGSQWWAMARDLLEQDPTFRDAVEAFDAEFRPVAGWSITEELLRGEAESRIDDTTVTQPALFAIQIGLAALWRRFGVTPDMATGHSIGEAAAAYVAGGLSLKGAARFLSKRGMIRDQLGQKGAMAAIGLNHEDVEALLPGHGRIGIAAINGPGSTTVSGDHDALLEFVEDFQGLYPDTFIRILKVDTAWHSYQLDAGEAWFRREVSDIDWATPELPFISTVTAKPETRFDTDYGWLNLRRPVNFMGGIQTALQMGATTFVELGPHSTLAGPAVSTAMEAGARVTVVQSLRRRENDFDRFARTAAQLFVEGSALDWAEITRGQDGEVRLPAPPWQGEPFWKGSEEADELLRKPIRHPFLGQRQQDAVPVWRSEINLKAYAFLRDHRLQSDVIFPAAGYIDTLLAMGRELFGEEAALEIREAAINDAMFIPEERDILLNATYEPARGRVALYSRQRGTREDWVLRAAAYLSTTDVPRPARVKFDPEDAKLERISLDEVYDPEGDAGFVNYGPAFQTIRDLWMTRRSTTARITYPEEARAAFGRHFAHPAMLDGALQITEPRMTLKGIRRGRQPGDPVYLPTGAGRVRFYAPLPEEIFVHARQVHDLGALDAKSGFTVTDADGNVLMTVDDLSMRELPTKVRVETEGEVVPSHVVQTMTELRDGHDLAPAGEAPGHWLLLGEAGEDTQALQAAMERLGAEVTLLDRAGLGDRLADGVNAGFGEDLATGRIAGILHAGALALPAPDETAAGAAVMAPVEAVVRDLVSLGDLMDFHRGCPDGLARVVILTSGACPVPDAGPVPATILSQAPLLALGRGLATEAPEYTLRMIDADAEALARPAALAARILGHTEEVEVALRGPRVFAPRLGKREAEDFDPTLLTVPAEDSRVNFHATMRAPGVIDELELNEIPLEPLGETEVRVRIRAVGLNFRDVMAVTGLLPREAEREPAHRHLGLEFGAVVEEVGAKVTGFAPGDRVMGLGRRCLQRFMTVDPNVLTRLPEAISLEQAATIPSAFATAHYALNHMGRMRAGERVLIHVATGGVGTAAVQLAQAAGAEIFATAGSPAKRRLLKEQGVRHVMDSRSLKFADDVARITKGEGVDVLLNSLPGDYIAKGLEIMAPYGRFLEIGKRDVYADSSIGMKPLRRNVSVSVIDLAAMGIERPQLMREMFDELIARFETGELAPLPVTAFPVSRIAEAFRYMSQARHVGKVVVTLDEDSYRVRRDPERPVRLEAEGSYLVTGGTRGFSLDIADWLSRAGAGEVILASRSGEVAARDRRKLARMEERGTVVTPLALDVTDAGATSALVRGRAAGPRPIRGVVHGAAVIKDGFASQLTDEMIHDVLAPKIAGGWNLHRAFAEAGVEPDFMIGFSSVAQVIGSGGQANYIAANAFLEALALYRASRGQPGQAINWGAIGESGFVARSENLAGYLESVGLHGLTRKQTEAGMALALGRDVTSVTYTRTDWQQVARANTVLGRSPRFADLLARQGGGTSAIRARLMSLEGPALREEAAEFILSEICAVLKVERGDIHTDRPMSELGLDSLSSFELKMRIETALAVAMPVSKFLSAPSVDELKEILAAEIETLREAETAREEAGEDETGTAAQPRRQTLVPSDAQVGLVQATLAPLTSEHARRALEHVLETRVDTPVTEAGLQKAAARLLRRHPLLALGLASGPAGGGDTLDFGGGPRVAAGRGGLLDVAGGELVRLSHVPGEDGSRIILRMHHAVGDRASAEQVLADLAALLEGAALPRAAGRAALVRQLERCRFDPDSPRGQNDRSFWWYAMMEDPAPLRFEGRHRALAPLGLGHDRGPAAALETGLAREWPEADLLLAFAAALRAVTETAGPVLLSRGARQEGGAESVGPWDLWQPLAVPDDPADHPARAALQRVLRGAAAHGSFGSHAACRAFQAHYAALGVTPWQVGFSMPERPAPAEATLFDLHLEALGSGDTRRLRLIHDTDAVGTETAQAILAHMVAGLPPEGAAGGEPERAPASTPRQPSASAGAEAAADAPSRQS
jgi:acyl transferase domain-containing protein/NADPH:quinone reductase-like Zn-dependent oxidoreductase/acyl carrier protein